MDKIMVGTEESTGAVIQRCCVNKVFLKVEQNVHWSLFLMKFQALRPATLLKSDSRKSFFLWILQSF